jgi:hypothetical protein
MFEVGRNGMFLALAIIPLISLCLLGFALGGHWLARRALAGWMDRRIHSGWASMREGGRHSDDTNDPRCEPSHVSRRNIGSDHHRLSYHQGVGSADHP